MPHHGISGAEAVASGLGAAVMQEAAKNAGRLAAIPSIGFEDGDLSAAEQAVRDEGRALQDAMVKMAIRTGGSPGTPEDAAQDGLLVARFYRSLLSNNVPDSIAGKLAAAYVGRMRLTGGDK